MNKILIPVLFLFSFTISDAKTFALRNDSTAVKHPHSFIAYSPGTFAPFGLMGGYVWKKGFGFYLSARCNINVFRKSQYHFDGSAIDDRSLNWYYTGEKKYSRYELNAGALINVFSIKDKASLKIYLGTGFEKPRYLYAYAHGHSLANSETWVVFNEISHANINSEAGVLFWMNKGINLHVGLSTIHKKHERMIEFGIGFELEPK